MPKEPSDAPPALGDLVRRYREIAGLSQEALAERAGMSPRGLLYLERGLRRPYPATLNRLADALALTTEERRILMRAAQPGSPAAPPPTADTAEPPVEHRPEEKTAPPSTGPGHNLPISLSSFIGREQAQAKVRDLLISHRLVTLVGAGGVGKTRLALAVAEGILAGYPDGVWLVELAALTDPGQAPNAVAQLLGLHEEPGRPVLESLCAHCTGKRLLLVLDNCEHLLSACTALAGALLRAAPELRILATSREALGVTGERRYRVPSLSVPDPQRLPSPELAGSYEAVRLFVTRAQEQRDTFTLTTGNSRAVAEICARVDGIPLAIELAAARVGGMSVEAIAAHLDDRFRLLNTGSGDLPTRQRTLRATLDWSWDLLDARERTLLGRISVFAGGWTLEAASAVCAGEGMDYWAVVDGIDGLVNRSLVHLDESPEGTARYRLLESVRRYAAEQLAATGEDVATRDKHLAYCLTLAEEAAAHLTGPRQATWLDRLEQEHDNLRAALAWSREQGAQEAGLRLGGALWRFWILRGHLSEGRRWLGAVLGESGTGPAAARATALNGAGMLAYRQGDYRRAMALLEESVALYREAADPGGSAAALNNLGIVLWEQGEYERAADLYEESLALRRELGDMRGIATSLNNLGGVAYEQGEYERAAALYEECLARMRELGDRLGIAGSLNNLGSAVHFQGGHDRAAALHEEALAIRREFGDRWSIAASLLNLGNVVYEQGGTRRAAALLEESLALHRELGDLRGVANSLNYLGKVAYTLGEYGRAAALSEECLTLKRKQEDKGGIVAGLSYLGNAVYALGDKERATALLVESLTLSREIGDKRMSTICLEQLAAIAGGRGQAERAAQLFGAAEAARRRIKAPLPPIEQPRYKLLVAAAQAQLDEETFTAAWAAGQAMTLDEAAAAALKAEPAG
jgi:predicted ATPase/transcriptional regulator with XRE-family HTH domain/Tfp pilus assembly protein PilF